MLKEWPLVAFTILGQTAVGVFLVFHLPFLVWGRLPGSGWRLTWLVTLALVLVLTAVAALVSLIHLRHPFRARFALSNWRTSWLSREILFELAFLGLVAGSGWLAWAGAPSRGTVLAALAAAGAAGALFLVSMIRLYTLPTLPAWRGSHTPLSFVLTTLALGALTTETVVRAIAGPGAFGLDLVPISVALIAVDILWTAVKAPRFGLRGARARPSLRPDGGPPRRLHAARLACLAAGFAFAVADLAGGGNHIMDERGADPALLLALGFVLSGEVAGRFFFYGLVIRPGD